MYILTKKKVTSLLILMDTCITTLRIDYSIHLFITSLNNNLYYTLTCGM